MAIEIAKELSDTWGIPFVIHSMGGKFQGKVKLNKFLSNLQRDGFPIKNKFKNHIMGPYDKKIDAQVEELQQKEILTYEEKSLPEKENKMSVYRLTKQGKEIVVKEIFPFVKKLPYDKMLRQSFHRIKRNFDFSLTEDVVKITHKDLYLDDFREFSKKVLDIRNSFKKIFKERRREKIDFCFVDLKQMGIFEFTIDALGKIFDKHLKDYHTGKNHVLFNGQKMLNLIGQEDVRRSEIFEACKKNNRCLHDSCPLYNKLIERINYRFYCLEYNSSLYNILKPIDIETYPFDEFFAD